LVWAIATITRAGAKAPLNLPTTTIVERPTGSRRKVAAQALQSSPLPFSSSFLVR